MKCPTPGACSKGCMFPSTCGKVQVVRDFAKDTVSILDGNGSVLVEYTREMLEDLGLGIPNQVIIQGAFNKLLTPGLTTAWFAATHTDPGPNPLCEHGWLWPKLCPTCTWTRPTGPIADETVTK